MPILSLDPPPAGKLSRVGFLESSLGSPVRHPPPAPPTSGRGVHYSPGFQIDRLGRSIWKRNKESPLPLGGGWEWVRTGCHARSSKPTPKSRRKRITGGK